MDSQNQDQQQGSGNEQNNQFGYEENRLAADVEPEIDTSVSPVASTATKNAVIYVIMGLVLVYAVYFNFLKKTPEEVKQAEEKKLEHVDTNTKVSEPPAPIAHVQVPTLPELPETPALTPPTPPAQALLLPPPPTIGQVEAEVSKPNQPIITALFPEGQKQASAPASHEITKDQRRKSGIVSSGGGGGSGKGVAGKSGAQGEDVGEGKDGVGKDKKTPPVTYDPFFRMDHTSAAQTKASTMGNAEYLIAQGKIIDIVLETGINTDIPGPLRGVVSRDVFSEAGKRILIPKGSRVIGSYGTTSPKRGETRIAISWSRIIRPDGIDVNITAPGVDDLGRAGAEGQVDNRYMELFGNAILLSIVNITMAYQTEKQLGAAPSTNTTSSSTATGTTTTTGSTTSATGQAIQDAGAQMGDITKGVLQDYLKVNPTITIEQGTKMKIFVQQDILFPENFDINGKVIQ